MTVLEQIHKNMIQESAMKKLFFFILVFELGNLREVSTRIFS